MKIPTDTKMPSKGKGQPMFPANDMGDLSIRGKSAKNLMHLKPGAKFKATVHGKVRSLSADQYDGSEPSHRVSVQVHKVMPAAMGAMSQSKTTRQGI